MRFKILFAIGAMLVLAGCNVGATPTAESPTSAPATEATGENPPAETETVSPSQIEAENVIAFEEMGIAIGFNFPDGILQGTDAGTQPVYEIYGPTELPYPQHARILFTSYTNGATDHTASGIRVYRVDEVNALEAGVVENLFAVLEGQTDHHSDFPRFSGAGALIDAQLVELGFHNGRGYRYVFTTSFAADPVRGTGMNLLYQGITDDEKYFISVILPINASFLNEFLNQNPTTSEEFTAHYEAVNARINSASADEFTPSMNAVDELISSIVILER